MPMGIGLGIGISGSSLGGPAWASGMDLWRDFVNNSGSLSNPTDTHASTIYAPNAVGLYTPYAANVLTRTDLGLQTVPTRTNSALQSQDFASTWTRVTGTTVVANDKVAPDGTTTADKITADGGGTSNQGVHQVVDTGTTIASKSWTGSFFIYSATAFTGTIRIRGNGATQEAENFSVSVPANQWTRIVGVKTFTGAADGNTVFFGFINDFGASVARTYWLWQGQYELGAFATPPILTTTTAVTVNGNQQVISGLGTQLAVGVAGFVQINALQAGAANCRVLSIDDGTANNRIQLTWDASNGVLVVTTGGVSQATGVTIYASQPTAGLATIAFAVGTNYAMARAVGQAAPTADTSVSYPVVDRAAIGGLGYSVAGNVYQYTRKLALKFGPQDAGTFAQMYALAQIAAAS